VLTISYDGAGFAGFQCQPGLRTVQGVLEEALETVTGRKIKVTGAGRTDSGVHALGQVVSFDPPDGKVLDRHTLMRSLNALAGPDIVVSEVRTAPAGFDARHSAVAREYRYRIVPGPAPPLFLRGCSWWVKSRLDVASMREAACSLVGQHDFGSFCVAASGRGRSTIRDIEFLEIESDREMGEHVLVVKIVGRSFLHSMVRVIVGSLVEVGQGKRPVSWMSSVLEARDRAAAGPTAPPEGLVMWHVSYPEEYWL